MIKKIIAITLTIAILLPLLSFMAFAAESDGFDIFGLLDGIGGFFRDIAAKIGEFTGNIISALRRGINEIGGFFSKLIKAMSSSLNFLLESIKRLFIPNKDYFPRIQEKLSTALANKFGGLTSLLNYLKTRFSGLKSNSDALSYTTLKFPKGHMFYGTQIDMIRRMRNQIPFMRNVLSGIIMLTTVSYAYRKLQTIIDT